MASNVDICNLALAHLGDDATVSSISPPEGSAQAEHCARFYPIARDVALEAHPWNFATKRTLLAEVTDAAPDSWQYAYSLPADCLGASSVLNIWEDGSAQDDEGRDFIVETLENGNVVIYTDAELATCRYIARVTDTTKYSPLFIDTLSWLLASYLAGPVVKGETGMQVSQGMLKMYMNMLGKASTSDASARKIKPKHTPEWVSARGMNTQIPDAWVRR